MPEHLAWLAEEACSLALTVLAADTKRFGQELARVKKFLKGRHLHAARFFRLYLGELCKLDEKRYDIDESQWKRTDLGHIASERIRESQRSDRGLYKHRPVAEFRASRFL